MPTPRHPRHWGGFERAKLPISPTCGMLGGCLPLSQLQVLAKTQLERLTTLHSLSTPGRALHCSNSSLGKCQTGRGSALNSVISWRVVSIKGKCREVKHNVAFAIWRQKQTASCKGIWQVVAGKAAAGNAAGALWGGEAGKAS